jgi:ABC-type Na+ efflux pump permease subunit
MIAAQAWKEYREQRTVWLAMAGLGWLALWACDRAVGGGDDVSRQLLLLTLGAVLAWIYGMVCGATLLAGEREQGTLAFLDTLPRPRAELWAGKCLAGAGLVLAQVVLVLSFLARLHALGAGGAGPVSVLTPAVAGFVGLGWGLLFSANSSSAFRAIAKAAIAQLAVGYVLAWPLAAVEESPGRPAHLKAGREHAILMFGVCLPAALALARSAAVFSRPDRLRES